MVFFPSEQEIGEFGIPRKGGSLIAKQLPSDGNWIYSVEVEPTEEPVTVDELKEFARIDYDDEDTLLEEFLKAVRQAAEEYTGRKFIEQTIILQMDYWPGRTIELPVCPVISITKVGTLDEDEVETEYSSAYYYLVKGKTLNRLFLQLQLIGQQKPFHLKAYNSLQQPIQQLRLSYFQSGCLLL